MARIFLTKVWGFSPEEYPALGFSNKGGRIKYLRESKPGDWVVLAGTREAPTPPEFRGRLLGKVQLGPEEIDVEEVLHSIGTVIPEEDYLEDGRYRWPYGLPMINAQRFLDLPDLASIFGDYLSGTQWAAYALDLENTLGRDAVAKVEALRTEPVNIAEAPPIVRQRERQRALELNQAGKTGPAPSTNRSGSERLASAASAYMLELKGGTRKIFKVGFSCDVAGRIADLNKGLLSTVTGFSWALVMSQEFATEQQAYEFEQALHARLRNSLVNGEKEIYSIQRKEIDSAWIDIFHKADWAI